MSDRISKDELWNKTGEELVQQQLLRRKWKWLGHTFRRSDDSVDKQALQWTLQGHRGRGRPRNLTFTFTFTFGAGAVKLPSAEAVLSSAQCASPV